MIAVAVHPCFSEKAHFEYGRIHLPVATQCNIECRYCSREIGISYHSYRPAVAREVLSPAQAVERVSFHMNDRLKVVGIAGPGEPLCNVATFETLSLVHKTYPHLLLCVATNGVELCEKAFALAELGVQTVTVTVNTVNAETVPRIYAHIQGKMDSEVAEEFIRKQLEGIGACVRYGIAVKINSVLIPGINMDDLHEVAVQCRKRGAVLHNITPLIPLAELSGIRPPTCEEIQSARSMCEPVLSQFRLCRQCAADAVGIPGRSEFLD